MKAGDLYAKTAELIHELVPWQYIPVDCLVEQLENRAFFNIPGFCESTVLRKALIYQALMSNPHTYDLQQAVTIAGAVSVCRRIE